MTGTGGHVSNPTTWTPTTIPAVTEINGVYALLEGVRQGQDNLMGGFKYLELQPDGVIHEGIDLNSRGGGDADLGALVVAPLDGVVTFVQWWDGRSIGFGSHLAMAVDDARAAQPCYLHVAHLNTVSAGEGQRVVAGQALGTCGKTGNQPYAHVHTALWHEVPPGGWNFWQTGYSKAWVAERTLDPQKFFWASVAKAGEMSGDGVPAEEVEMLEDWQIKGWLLAPLYQAAQLPYNPESGTAQAWVDRLREGHYVGRPRSAEQPYGEGEEAGVWVEWERGALLYRLRDGQTSWNG